MWLAVLTRDGEDAATPRPVQAIPDALPLRPRLATMHKSDIGIITQVDVSASLMLGWTPEQLIGLRSTELIHPEDFDRAVSSWMELYFHQGRQSVRVRHRCADGNWL